MKLAIKVDWLNSRVEFSPNIIISQKITKSATGDSEIDKTIFQLEINPNYEKKQFPSYSASNDKLDVEDVWENDDTTTWWVNLIDNPASLSQNTNSNNNTLTSDNQKDLEKKKIEAQMTSIKKLIADLDNDFQQGIINQELFVKKKEFLAEKLGSLMGQYEQI